MNSSSARGLRAPARVGDIGLGAARGFVRADHDLYPTERPVAEALVAAERFDDGAWECACGLGDLSKVLLAAGVDVVSTDLIARGYGRGGVDFLRTTRLRKPAVVTNPPFRQWKAFAWHALQLGAAKVALLGRLLTLEDWDDRADFFRQTRLSRVLVTGRSKMRPVGTPDRGYKGMVPFAWYIWDRAARWVGGPVVQWPRAVRA